MNFFARTVVVSILIYFLLAIPATAGSTALSHSSFTVSGESGQIFSEELEVSNLEASPQRYQLSAPSNRQISMMPANFQLAPYASTKVLLRFRQTSEPLETELALLSFSPEQTGNLRIASGIKIPVRFSPGRVLGAIASASASPLSVWWSIIVYIIDGALLLLIGWISQARFWRWQRYINHQINFIQ